MRNDGGKERELKVRCGRTKWITIQHTLMTARSAGRRSQEGPGWPLTDPHSGPGIFRAPPENGRTDRSGNVNFLRPPALPPPPAGPAASCLTLLSVRNVEYGGSGADMVAESLVRGSGSGGRLGAPSPLSVMCSFLRGAARRTKGDDARRVPSRVMGKHVKRRGGAPAPPPMQVTAGKCMPNEY